MTYVLRKVNYKNYSMDVLFEYIVFKNDFAWLQITGDNIRYFNNHDKESEKFLDSLNYEKNVFADFLLNIKGHILYNKKKIKLD